MGEIERQVFSEQIYLSNAQLFCDLQLDKDFFY